VDFFFPGTTQSKISNHPPHQNMNPSQIISDDPTEQFMEIMNQTILEAANAEAEAANAKAEAANAKAEVARLKAEVAQLETSGKPCPFCKKLYVPKYKTLAEAQAAEPGSIFAEQHITGCCSDKCWDDAFDC